MTKNKLSELKVESAKQLGSALEAEVLIMHALSCTREQLFLAKDDFLSDEQLEKIKDLISRRLAKEPVAYITGKKEFYSREFEVSTAVLIPRPETELLVESALSLFSAELRSFRAIDIGTGSSAIITTLLLELEGKFSREFLDRGEVCAYDISPLALELAMKNAEKFGIAEKIKFLKSDLLSSYQKGEAVELELFLSNPPYVPDKEVLADDVVKYEPELALRAGEEGLDIITRLVSEISLKASAGAIFVGEIGHEQSNSVESLLRKKEFSNIEFIEDYSGVRRIVKAQFQ